MSKKNFIELKDFKMNKCKKKKKHNIKKCKYYHFEVEKRRSYEDIQYSKVLCKKKNCKDQQCQFAHNITEQLYHPENYKKKFCKNVINGKKCKFGKYCALAHSEEEIQIKLLHKMKLTRDFFL